MLGFICVCNSPKREPLVIYPEIPLPSGSLVFTANSVVVFRLDSGQSTDEPVARLHTSTVGSPIFSSTLSPDGSNMVFIWSRQLSEESAGPSASAYYPRGVYLLDLTSDQPPALLWRPHDGPEESDDPWPSSSQWSADGKWIVFLIGSPDHKGVYRLSPETLTLQQTIDCDCQFVIPTPTSDRLLFTLFDRTAANQETGVISLVEKDGTIKVLAREKGVDHITKPSWSPDESQVAFTMQIDEQGYRGVFLLNTDGTGLMQLTHDDGYYHSPVWSPNGKMLAFIQKSYAGSSRVASRIILMDLQTREMQTLLIAPTELTDLQWLK